MPERSGPDPERVREALRNTTGTDAREEEQGPNTEDLNEDPAYNPEEEGLDDLKGG